MAAACVGARGLAATRFDESSLGGELGWVEIHSAEAASTEDDESILVRWWENEFHFAQQVLRTCVVGLDWWCGCGCGCGCVM